MVEMDYILGKLVDKLEEVGELENTLIIFTSDQLRQICASAWRSITCRRA